MPSSPRDRKSETSNHACNLIKIVHNMTAVQSVHITVSQNGGAMFQSARLPCFADAATRSDPSVLIRKGPTRFDETAINTAQTK